MLLLPYRKTPKRLREVLNQLYGHLDGSGPVSEFSFISTYLSVATVSVGHDIPQAKLR